MDIKKAKNLADEILDICNQLEDEVLTEACSGIYNNIQSAKSTEEVVVSVRELMVFVNEADWDEDELSDLRNEIEELFIKLLEEFEEF